MTKAAKWARALLAWEWAMNVLLQEDLDVEDRIAVYRAHHLLRTRASGETTDVSEVSG